MKPIAARGPQAHKRQADRGGEGRRGAREGASITGLQGNRRKLLLWDSVAGSHCACSWDEVPSVVLGIYLTSRDCPRMFTALSTGQEH